MVAKRTKQLMKGAETTVAMRNNKYVVTSLREVAIGNVGFEGNWTMETAREQIEKDLNK
jgi:DNA-directed RNA polymerase subunit omega